jgi:hypothetical protein
MKTIILLSVIILLPGFLIAQDIPSDSLFIVTCTTGSLWDKSKEPAEQAYFKDHSSRLGKWRQDRVIKLGARYADKGIIIISAATMTAAKDIILSDPAVINKLFEADLQKLNVFYDGCVTRKK